MKKLAILIYSLGGGGAERVLITLLPYLQKKFEVHVFLLDDKNSYGIEIDYEVIGSSKSTESSILKFLKIPFLAFLYARKLKKEGITLSLSLLNRPNYINILAAWFAPMTSIISEHATPSKQYRGNSLGALISRWLIRFLYPKARHIIAVSYGVKNDLEQHFNIVPSLITTIYNPFDIQEIHELGQKTSTRIQELQSFKQKRNILVAIGRLDSGKNHRFLINAIALFKQRYTAIAPPLLIILGEGALKDMLIGLISENKLEDCVILEGFVPNPYPYIALADATICSSLYEGFLNVLVESLALGIPAISSNCPSGPKEILKSQKDGYSCEREITQYGVLYPIMSASTLNEQECLDILVHILYEIHIGIITFDKTQLRKRAEDFDKNIINKLYFEILNKSYS